MANEQNKRQSERQGERPQGERPSTAIERSGDAERGLATRQYQDPFSAFDSLFERLQHNLFGTSLLSALIPRGGEGDGGAAVRVPRIQLRDTGDALELTAEMPGIEPSNVSVNVEDDVLTISGEQRTEEEREGTRAERYVSFYRQIALPEGIDTEQAEAAYKNGMLAIRFPKTQPRSNAREIPVTTEQGGRQSDQKQSKERAA